MLLPPKKSADGSEPEDPRAELVRRLLEYEQIKLGAAKIDALPLLGRDFLRAQVTIEQSLAPRFPEVSTPTTCARPGPTSSSAPGSTSTTPSAASS
jgi:segregation and condensation protein A